jgi:ribose transport system permease protein
LTVARMKRFVVEHKLLLVIVAVGAFVSFRTSNFLSFGNIKGILSNIGDQGIIVIGMAMLIILGEIDLSVGSIMAMGSVLAIIFQAYGVVFGILGGLIGGTIFGILNGLLVTKTRLSSLGATLGTMIFVNGLVFAVTREHTIIGSNRNFALLAETQVLRIPLPIIVFFVLLIVFEIILQKSVFGRKIFAIGGNATASRFFGIKVDRVRIICFSLTGLLSGLAGVILAAKLNVASGTIGLYTPVLVITAVLLGGTSLSGGEGSIIWAFEGILFIGTLNNAMVLLRISSFIQQMIQGLLLIFIVVVDAVNSQKKKFL